MEVSTHGLVIDTAKEDRLMVQDLLMQVFSPTRSLTFVPFSLRTHWQVSDASEKYWLLMKEHQDMLCQHDPIYIGDITEADMHNKSQHPVPLYQALMKIDSVTAVEKTPVTLTHGKWYVVIDNKK